MTRALSNLYFFGLEALARGKFIRAKQVLDRMQQRDPENPLTLELSGDYAREIGEKDEAFEYYIKLTDASKSAESRAVGFMNLGSLSQQLWRFDDAIGYFQNALDLYEELGYHEDTFHARNAMNVILHEVGKYQEAFDESEKLLHRIKANRHRYLYMDVALDSRRIMADSLRFLNRFDEAEHQWQRIQQIATKYNLKEDLADALDGIGIIRQLQGRFEEAKEFHRDALRINRAIRVYDRQSMNLINLSRIHMQLGDLGRAERCAQQSLKIELKLENVPGIEFARLVMAQIKISRKDYSNALRELLQLEKTSPIKNPRDDWVAIANQLGYVYRMLGNLDEAEKRQLKVLAWARKNKQFEVTAAACDELAEIAIARSNKKLAREYLDQTLRCFISLELTPMIEATQRRIDELELD